jgi:hypothetical protein
MRQVGMRRSEMNYIQVSRSDCSGGYTVPREGLAGLLDGEFDGLEYLPVGTSITLTVVEMSQEEFKALPEFMGW